MALFVLVHGAWHVGTAWDLTARKLVGAGHRVLAPTMAGHGKGADRRVNHAACVRSIVDSIANGGANDFILVGHSFGGTIISKVAEAIPEKIRRLVFMNAFVLRDGHSLVDEVPPPTAGAFTQMAENSPDQTFLVPFPVWRETFINDADLDTAKRIYAQLSPEPLQPCIDKLDLKRSTPCRFREPISIARRISRCRPASGAGIHGCPTGLASIASCKCRAATK